MALPPNYRQVSISKAPSNLQSPYRLSRVGSSFGLNKGDIVTVNPFKQGSHGNPSFNPQKVGVSKLAGGSSNENRILKPPKAPDKPLMPYMRFSRKVWDQVKASNPELKLWEIGKIIGSKWRDLPDSDKQDFVDEYELEKSEYEKALKVYHASPSYQAYLTAKSKSSSVITTDEVSVERCSTATSGGGVTMTSKVDRRIDIQPAEDENDYDESLSVKNISHSRYMRNHRLINEIFSDTLVPDVRTVVTSQRLSVLRRQVQSLTMHQEKLETELKQIEEKFESKKRKFMDLGKNFQVELKKIKVNAPKVDAESFTAMVEKQKELLRREAEEKQMKKNLLESSQAAATSSPPAAISSPSPAPSAAISLPSPAPSAAISSSSAPSAAISSPPAPSAAISSPSPAPSAAVSSSSPAPPAEEHPQPPQSESTGETKDDGAEDKQKQKQQEDQEKEEEAKDVEDNHPAADHQGEGSAENIAPESVQPPPSSDAEGESSDANLTKAQATEAPLQQQEMCPAIPDSVTPAKQSEESEQS